MKKLLLILLCLPLIGFGQGREKYYGGSNDDFGYAVKQTIDGGYIVCGSSMSFGNGYNNTYLVKTDINGIEMWSKTFGGVNFDRSYSVSQTNDGGFIVAGYSESFGTSKNIYIIKTDGNGNITSTFNIPTPNSNRKIETIVDILGKETKPKTNTPFIEIYSDGTVEKKIIIE